MIKITHRSTSFHAIGIIALCTVFASFLSSKQQKPITAEEVIASHIVAKGGLENLKKVKTFSVVLEEKLKDIRGQSFRVFPDKLCDVISHPGGQTKSILNGDIAQLIISDTAMPILNPIFKQNMVEDARIFPVLYPSELGHKRSFAGEKHLDGILNYVIEVTLLDSLQRTYFYDSSSWLLTKIIDETGMERIFSDFHNVSGIQIPHRIRVISKDETLDFTVTHVEINPVLDQRMFEIK